MLGCVRTSKKKGLRLNSRPFPISVVIRFARVVRKTLSRVFHPALSPATIAPPRWRGHCMRIGRRSLAFLLLASATLWGENPKFTFQVPTFGFSPQSVAEASRRNARLLLPIRMQCPLHGGGAIVAGLSAGWKTLLWVFRTTRAKRMTTEIGKGLELSQRPFFLEVRTQPIPHAEFPGGVARCQPLNGVVRRRSQAQSKECAVRGRREMPAIRVAEQ